MLMVSNHVEFVKRQAEFNRRQYERLLSKSNLQDNTASGRRAAGQLPLYERLTAGFEALLAAIEDDLTTWDTLMREGASPGASRSNVGLDNLLQTPTELQQQALTGLPDDLIAQLQISDADRFQWCVVDLINRTPDKMISIEVLLIALYHITGKIYERADLANRMSRLSRKGAAFPVPGRKAVYTTIAPSGAEPTDPEEELFP